MACVASPRHRESCICIGKGKGKGHPITCHEGPEGEQRYSSTLSLNSALDLVGGQHHAPAALPGTHCIGGWMGRGPGLDGCGKSLPHPDSIPGPSSPQRVIIPTELSRPTFCIAWLIESRQKESDATVTVHVNMGTSCYSENFCVYPPICKMSIPRMPRP